MFKVLDIGASGLMAQRTRMDTIAQNVANAHTTRDAAGNLNPYRRRFTVFAPGQPGDTRQPGVHVKDIQIDRLSPLPKRFDPGHPDADNEGYISMPNVDLPVEFVNAIEASRAYEANITLMETSKAMFNATLRLIA